MGELKETERCPNCGKLVLFGESHYSSTIKTSWGGSTLYGVCEECAKNHDKLDVREKKGSQ